MKILNLRHLLLVLVLTVVSVAHAEDKTVVWNNPTSASQDGLSVTRVEFTNAETVLNIHYNGYSDKILFVPETYLYADGKRYAIRKVDGQELNVWWDINGEEKDYVFRFDPLPLDTRLFELHEGDYDRAFCIKGISTPEWMDKRINGSLYPSAWRNEETGDFELAMLDDQVVYGCQFWQYKSKDDKKGRYVVTNGREDMTITLGKEKKGVCKISFNGAAPRTYSRITTKHLPDYPTKDDNDRFNYNDFRADSAIVIGCYTGLSDADRKNLANGKTFSAFTNFRWMRDGKELYDNYKIKVDSLGHFRQAFSLPEGCNDMYIDGAEYLLEPGETYFLYKNLETGQTILMGKNARFQNEFLSYGRRVNGDFHFLYERNDSTYEQMVERTRLANEVIKKKYKECDSLFAAHPTLSARYRKYAKKHIDAMCLENIKSHRYLNQAEEGEKYIAQFIIDNLWSKRADDMYSIDNFAFPLCRFMYDYRQNFSPKEFSIEATNEEEAQRLFHKKTEIEPTKAVIDSLETDPVIRSLFVMRNLASGIESNITPMTPDDEQLLNDYVTIPALKEYVLKLNEKAKNVKFGEVNFSKKYVKEEGLKDITDGKALIDKIVEPFKGQYVLIDIWGTWCSPCKQAIKNSHKDKEELKDYDIVYIYLANNSPKRQWQTFINGCNAVGENCVHYNLPPEQQEAIERYFNVTAFPTYKLYGKDGNLVNEHIDARDTDVLKAVLDKHK